MQTKTILIAEDEQNLRVLIARILNRSGFRTLLAADGEEALTLLAEHHADVLITDLKMPGIDGLTLLRQARAMDPALQVILMTAHATLDTAVNALRSGARDYIIKPFDVNEIVETVRKALLVQAGEAVTEGLPTQGAFVAESPAMKELQRMIHRVAPSSATVLITGETGVGKELAAKAIHELSPRGKGPFIKVNCSALPEALLESELFGYEKGAFTGAYSQKPGRFELADGGTIFLDEIGDISPLIQVKLLRVLQHKEIERLGGTATLPVDVRIIAATHRDLEALIQEGSFREDLYYRLNVIPLHVPPLRARAEDIVPLIHGFVARASADNGLSPKQFTDEAMAALQHYQWPGNVRELENIVERLLVISEGPRISAGDLPAKLLQPVQGGASDRLEVHMDKAEETLIRKTLAEADGNVSLAAKMLGISRRSLYRKLEKYAVD